MGPHPLPAAAPPFSVPLRARLATVASQVFATAVQREALERRLLAVGDLLAAGLSLVVVLGVVAAHDLGLGTLVGLPLIAVLFPLAGLYERDRTRLSRSTLDEAPIVLQTAGLFAMGVAILQPVLTGVTLVGGEVAALWLITSLLILGTRLLTRWVSKRLLPVERCLVIGDVDHAQRVHEKLTCSGAAASIVASLPLAGDDLGEVGGPEGVRAVATELGIHRIIVASETTDTPEMSELVRAATAAGVRVSVLPNVLGVVGPAVELEDLEGMVVLGVRPFGLPRWSRAVKRCFDVVATSIGLLLLSPFIAAIAVAIKLDSRGPVFYRQVRVGRDGRRFRILKFRSMVVDAESQKDQLRALNEVGHGMFKISADPRVTHVGRLLRRTSLDELPQLINVLRGDMSLVGPRPLVTDEDALVHGLDRHRLHVTPGMTGPWQVLGARVPMDEMVGMDYRYVASWSLWLDVKLLMRTVRHVCRGGNV